MSFLETAAKIAPVLTLLGGVFGMIAKICKEYKKIRDAQKCQLRADMLRTYYRNKERKCIRQYEKQNFVYCYENKDVYFTFDREIITNAQENAQIDLTKAQEQQTKITTILNTSAQLGQELTMQLICEALELDYDDTKPTGKSTSRG